MIGSGEPFETLRLGRESPHPAVRGQQQPIPPRHDLPHDLRKRILGPRRRRHVLPQAPRGRIVAEKSAQVGAEPQRPAAAVVIEILDVVVRISPPATGLLSVRTCR